MNNIKLRDIVVTLMSEWRTASLATVDDDGCPHAANVNFVHDNDLNMYFISKPASAHASHIVRDPNVAMTIYAHVESHRDIHGIQLRGQCIALSDKVDRNAAFDLYAAKYPFVASNVAVRTIVKSETFYRLTPAWLRLTDNRVRFGWKQELDLSNQ